MSHPKVVESARFYNRYDHEIKQRSRSPDLMRDSFMSQQVCGTEKRFDPYAYSANLAKKLEMTPDKKHHLKYGLGIASCDTQKRHVFTELPGVTFNSNSWQKFSTQAAELHRSMSPVRQRLPQ
eukprot:CAMPEP_0202901294 /NCGR_PEP_ID=MMETSP1392-20130828/14175_1 /ASSEMBLY_ACC=CAM_ASM_000868 /TAXON_ID=225041 /ORGANISM="Chlamydomonas chlamydogama, Strain SAG 11-48b" /LENGTH=122 /DNA_ID=CAMNT_0049587839 /DNA_START=92 /DNA_END=460 /DNA_ORIENTATION=-